MSFRARLSKVPPLPSIPARSGAKHAGRVPSPPGLGVIRTLTLLPRWRPGPGLPAGCRWSSVGGRSHLRPRVSGSRASECPPPDRRLRWCGSSRRDGPFVRAATWVRLASVPDGSGWWSGPRFLTCPRRARTALAPRLAMAAAGSASRQRRPEGGQPARQRGPGLPVCSFVATDGNGSFSTVVFWPLGGEDHGCSIASAPSRRLQHVAVVPARPGLSPRVCATAEAPGRASSEGVFGDAPPRSVGAVPCVSVGGCRPVSPRSEAPTLSVQARWSSSPSAAGVEVR